ncbi:fluoride efflux transporter FluC [Lapidilactobacillus luobeiensis]|uniref:fluoride efflux transporter FluC n=1 Tax=Lapidilactobacillus luobeiensis TaxID=2950371 RepID=UPI0021C40553|nr:CrcB family protein [Lapidilactobacillus luobeiensis]
MTDLMIAFCAFWGGVFRLGTTQLLSAPWATLAVNLCGTLLLPLWNDYWGPGLRSRRQWLHVGVGTGFFGSFTTFSSFCLDVIKLLTAGKWLIAGIYLVLSLIGGILMAWAGITLAQHLNTRGGLH